MNFSQESKRMFPCHGTSVRFLFLFHGLISARSLGEFFSFLCPNILAYLSIPQSATFSERKC